MKLANKGEGEEDWFYTGDLVEFSNGKYLLWGKLNVYNIQIGDTLVNTVNVEKIILSNKDIDDCYVVGLGDVEVRKKYIFNKVTTHTFIFVVVG